MQCPQQHAAQRPGQQRIAAVARQLGTGVGQQVLEIGIQRRIAWRFEQPGQQLGVLGDGILLVEIDDQHAVVAHAGEAVVGIARHQTGAHPADFATGAIDLEFRAPRKRHHQLVIVVGVLVSLVIQAKQTGVEHDGHLCVQALYRSLHEVPTPMRRD